MNSYNVLGYTNPLRKNSVPIITIIEQEQKISALFPDLTINELNVKRDELLSLKTFKEAKPNTKIWDNQYSIINHDGIIISDIPAKMLAHFKIELKYIKNKTHYEMLEKLIEEEKNKLNEDEFDILMQFLNDEDTYNSIKIFSTKRKVSKTENDYSYARRIILQYKKRSSFKTVYKKNLFINEEKNRIHGSKILNNLTDYYKLLDKAS